MSIWVTFAGVAITACVAISLFILTGRRERRKVTREAAASFRAVFDATLSQLNIGMDAHAALTEVAARHDAAISEYRNFISGGARDSFDSAAAVYRRCRDALQPAMLEFTRSQASGQPIDRSPTSNVAAAMRELLSFAREP
jgi:uncharacterized protein YqfA (UPF0365 family)